MLKKAGVGWGGMGGGVGRVDQMLKGEGWGDGGWGRVGGPDA